MSALIPGFGTGAGRSGARTAEAPVTTMVAGASTRPGRSDANFGGILAAF
ncbi:hypothetical protein ACFWWA_35430 [Streptomyces goshikiensis]